jgi:sporulation protein YlmC with PRC-barrel domain
MKTFLISTCMGVALTGLAFAQTAQTTTPTTQTAPPMGGMQSTTPATVAVFYKIQPTDIQASKLIGTKVHNLNNENIGEIDDLVLDKGKAIQAFVLGVGGFVGVGERSVAVEPESVAITKQPDGTMKVVVNTTKKDLENAPEIKLGSLN